MKKLSIIFLCVVLVLLSACGQQNGNIGDTASVSKGGTFNLYSEYPDTFNPFTTSKWANSQILMNVFEGLFSVKPDKSVDGVLASSYKSDNTAMRYTISLKKDVVFHNGDKFSSRDVVYTLNCIKECNKNYADVMEKIASYYASDDYEVIIDLTEPVLDFAVYLDFPIIPFCYDSLTNDGKTFFDDTNKIAPIGTGAFMFGDDLTQTSMTLLKNTAWHGKDVYADKIAVTFMNDNTTALYSFNSCQTDIISSDVVKSGEFSFSNKVTPYEYAGDYYNYLAFNFNNTLLSDINIRKYISGAIDKKKIVNDVMHSHAKAVNVPINPDAYYSTSDPEIKYDTESIKNDLQKDGWTDLNSDTVAEKIIDGDLISLKFKLLVLSDNDVAAQTAEIIKDNLAKCMIGTEIESLEKDDYYNALKNGDFDLALVQYKMPKNNDVSELLSTEGIHNYYGFSDDETDTVCIKLKNASNAEDVKSTFISFAGMFSKKLAHVPLYFSTYFVYYQNYLKNLTYPSYNNIYNGLANIYIKY